ncbi:MAG: phytanoyl-CoA dioxygenase family protein [Verrucomicrobia bacterium]|nr:phytanoyl-CoA dioxygenase family protein [Verrucomicrobiota bacterium]
MNPDVRAAVRNKVFKSGRQHYDLHGRAEGRLGVSPFGEHATEFFGEVPVDLSLMGSLRADKFPYAGPYPWLDRPDALAQIEARVQAGTLSTADAEQCRKWVRDGYIILEGCVSPAEADRAWEAYEQAWREGSVTLSPDKISPDDPWPGRLLDAHQKVPAFCPIMRHPEILRWVQLLMDREPAPFQTIASHKGTQQAAHSDTIHMTTYPMGYLTAAWVALEDIHPDSGPLVYYPGSHRLPYVLCKEIGLTEEDFQRDGYQAYVNKYESKIAQVLAEHDFDTRHFCAKKGDVLIWHANLIHGGSPRNDVRHSRKALVSHYFVRGAVTYHELSAQRARAHSGTCLVADRRS